MAVDLSIYLSIIFGAMTISTKADCNYRARNK